ncbi:MAG: 4Fe-4S binding protein [Lachnospiraceae bacterium]|nr:4Fe-4S binding protein [Candidatus Minthocola equi]
MAEREKKIPTIDFEECAGCSVCIESCLKNCLGLTAPRFHGDTHTVAELKDADSCIGCGLCVKACPIEAIKLVVVE